MLFRSQIVTAASGSIAGTTFSHNRGGMYQRARVTPVNPNTPAQNFARTRLANLTNIWANTLSDVERQAWDLYALNVPLPDPFGDPRNVGGIGMYIRANLPRLTAALARQDIAPILFDVGEFTAVDGPTALAAGNLMGFTFDNTDLWANEDGAAMLVFGGRPKNPAVNFFTGPYRFAGLIAGDAITPPTSPASITNPFSFALGQRVFWRVQVTRVDGRYSTTQRQTAIAG